MAGIDDDLLDETIPQYGSSVSGHNEVKVRLVPTPQQESGIDIALRVIHYLMDAAMLVMSWKIIDSTNAFQLGFCIGLIIWMAYRILYFKRSHTIDLLIGLFLFIATVVLYIRAINEGDDEQVGCILIPTVYLVSYCVWGVIRRKQNEKKTLDE